VIEYQKLTNKKVIEAAKDLYYLLNRGYTRKFSISVVSNRYGLSKQEQMIIYRSIYPEDVVRQIKEKEISDMHLKGKFLAIDWYNMLVTVNSAITNKPIYMGNDGFIRDTRGLHGRVEAMENVYETVSIILTSLSKLTLEGIKIYLEKNISYSGEMKKELENFIQSYNFKHVSIILTSTVDKDLLENQLVATNDSVILLKAKRIFNLTKYILEKIPIKVTVYVIPLDS